MKVVRRGMKKPRRPNGWTRRDEEIDWGDRRGEGRAGQQGAGGEGAGAVETISKCGGQDGGGSAWLSQCTDMAS